MKTERIRTLSEREMVRIAGGAMPDDLEVRWECSLRGGPRHGPFGGGVRDPLDPRARGLAPE
jgi:hypothetical protein